MKYSKFEAEIKAEYEKIKGTRIERPIHEIAIEKCGFYLPDEARYDSITWSSSTMTFSGCRCRISRLTSDAIPTAATWRSRV